MALHPVQTQGGLRLAVVVGVVALVAAAPAVADPDSSGQIIDVNGAKRTAYPLAIPTGVNSDSAAATEVAAVTSFDLSIAGWFKIVDPSGFLADLSAEKMSIEPQKWKDVGAYGVIKNQVTVSGDTVEIEFKLYEVSKGTTPSLDGRDSGDTKCRVWIVEPLRVRSRIFRSISWYTTETRS